MASIRSNRWSLLVSESGPVSDVNPGVARPLSPGPAVKHKGSEPELGLDLGLSINTEEEESLRKVCRTGDARGVLEYESLSRNDMSGIF